MALAGFILILALSASAVAQSTADLILVNANIRTLESRTQRAEALAVAGNKIVAIGNNSAIRKFAGSKTRVLDAGGKLVIPGFNDAHVHFSAIGNRFSHIDLRGLGLIEIAEKIRHYTSVVSKGRWIIGSLGSHDDKSPEVLTRWTIDASSANHPILLYFADPKIALVNSEALHLAGITAKTPDQPGGQILKRSNGEPTGIITGSIVTRVRSLIPADHGRDWAQMAETASNYAASLGVTSVQDVHSDDLRDTLRSLHNAGRLKTRVYECLGIADWRKLADTGEKAAHGDALVRTGCVKAVAPDDDEIDLFQKRAAVVDQAGLQIMVHAIGENANSNTLSVFENVASQNGLRDRRLRIEHAYNLRSGDIGRLVYAGIIASMQPHLFFSGGVSDGDDYRALRKANGKLSFGSDASMTDFNPLLGVHAAVNSGSRSISVEDAVRVYTVGSAYAEFQEQVKGTLEVGMLADFVILSDDIFAIAPVRIKDVTVVKTIVDGKVVFERK